MNSPPRKHQPNESAGITEEVAAELDRGLAEMETGDPDGVVSWDESSETWGNIHPADIGQSSQALHKASSNDQVRFGALVEREKNLDPDIEHSEAYDRAVARFDDMQDDNEQES